MKKNDKSTLIALAFFAVLTLISMATTHAQVNLLAPIHTPDTNPLLSTTGPNTVGKGHLQLSGDANFYSFRQNMEMSDATVHHHNIRVFGGSLGLRFGLGSRLELSAGFSGAFEHYHFEFDWTATTDTVIDNTTPRLEPSLGLKLMLYEGGYGWVPQVSASLVYSHQLIRYSDDGWDTPGGGMFAALGFQFRNHLGNRWVFDYGLSYAFGKDRPLGSYIVYASQRDNPFQFNFMARWLATDKLMISAGMENVGGVAEVMWQATPNLQLKVQGGLAAGVGFRTGVLETNAQVGVNWMIR